LDQEATTGDNHQVAYGGLCKSLRTHCNKMWRNNDAE
jgi:hypothetical protein